MATGGFDWVAVFGILGTLSGVTVIWSSKNEHPVKRLLPK
jgi:hypothetical protein